MGDVLIEIIQKLRDAEIASATGPTVVVPIPYLFAIANSLEKSTITPEAFKEFIGEIHNSLIRLDSARRSALFRIIRFCLQGTLHVKLFIQEELHWIVIATLEKDPSVEFNVERIQALKIIDRVRRFAGDIFPIGFARSLVAIANCKEDNFRRLCLDSLRELALVNPSIVGTVGGFTTLLDAVLDPISSESAEKILHSILFLLNDPITRKILTPCIDLKILLSPFSDLDTDEKDIQPRWTAAKNAFATVMKTWVGVVTLTADELALPFLMTMLRDSKLPTETHAIILDCIQDILMPIYCIKRKVNPPSRNFDSDVRISPKSKEPSNSDFLENNRDKRANSDSDTYIKSDGLTQKTGRNKSILAKDKLLTNSGSSSSLTNLVKEPSTTTNRDRSSTSHRSSFSFADPFFQTVKQSNSSSNISQSGDLAIPTNNNTGYSGIGTGNSAGGSSGNLAGQNSTNGSKHFSISSLFSRHHHNNNVNNTSPGVPFRRASATAASTKSSMPGNYPPTRPESAKLEKRGTDPIIFAQKPVTPIHLNTSSTISDKPSTPVLDSVGEFEPEFDSIYNLMDNYAALLCSSFMHVDLIQSLISLGTEGERGIAERSRKLLVTFLTILSNLLPESVCAELLISPSLLELAASLGPRKSPNKSYKASLILLDIANTFTIMPLPSTQATALAESNIGGLMLSTQSQSARPRTGSNVRGSLYVTASSPLKSNLPSLNIQNLYLLMEEVKVCTITNHQHFYEQSNPQPNSSRVRVEGLWKNGGVSGSKGNAGNNGEIVYAQPSDLLSTIAAAITPVIDKNEFNRQLDVTKVKEGKEPFKWDWITISQLLEHSFTQPDRLQEALRSKWLRRISGFFRCSPEEKGYFANMDWEPNNLQYLEIACNLYSVLMKEDVGFQFLTQDRRGMIFNEIAYELELLTNYASNRSNQVFNLNPFSGNNGTNGSGGNSSTGISSSKMVFRMHSCSYSMAREFFSLLGRILRNNKSRRLLDHTNVFQHLTVLGQYHSLDYVSRLVITSLSFTDGGIISRHLYQFWTADEINGSCSKLLREYLFNLLRVLIRCQHHHKHFQDQELYMWCVETILSQLAIDDDTSHNINVNESLCILYKGMMECLHSRTCAQLVISKRPRFILNHYQQLIARLPGNVGTVPLTASTSSSSNDDASAIHNKEMLLHGILIRLLGFSEGIQFLSEKSYVDTLIQTWCQQRNKDYVTLVEERMNNAMLQAHHLKAHHSPLNGASVDMLSLIQPIPMKIPDVSITYNKFSPSTFTTSDVDTTGFDPYQQLDFDFHGLFRVPWNIEAKIVNHGLMTSDIVSNTGEYIRVDAFLDISEVHSPLAYEVTYDRNRYLKVRGIVLDSKGFPGGKAVNPNASVFSTLLAGISPIFKNGTVQTLGESGSIRKRTSTNARDVSNSVTTSSRSSFVGSSTPGANNEVFQDNDLPVTLGQEQSYEWITCRAGHRQGSNLFELEDGRFAVAIPNEPVAFIFSRKAPLTSTSSVGQRNKSMSGAGSRSNSISDPWFDANRTNRTDSSRSGGMLYLVEIHYFISVETGQAMFVPMPRHLFGELGRTVDGCAELTKRNLIFEMVGKAHNLFDQLQKPSSISSSSLTGAGVSTPLSLSTTSPHAIATSSLQTILSQHANNTLELRAILWSLGHLASNDLGLGLLLGVDPSFIEWCVESVANCNYFSLRGTFFHIIGLISRSLAGGKKLNRLGWHSADYGNPSAVAVPRSTSGMFGRSNSVSNDPLHNSTSSSGLGMKKAALALSRLNVPHAPVMPFMNNLTIPQAVKNLVPFPPLGTLTVEQEVLNIILKMPGVILYRECKSKLDHIRRENSDVFSKRSLFVDVMRIMEVYNFKLSVRREILALFSETAKQRPVTPVSSISCGESFSERQ